MFDSHAHYDDEQYDGDREAILSEIRANGVTHVVNPGADLSSSRAAVALAETHPHIWAAAGVHPHAAKEWTDETEAEILQLLAHRKTVAVGEIGLDYHYDFSPRDKQKDVFYKQIELGIRVSKPLIVHDREAHQDMMDILRQAGAHVCGGVMHMFSGSVESARLLLDMNFYIGLGGPVTFKNASRVLDVVRFIPDDRLLIETDSPYMAPVPHRGKRNRSDWLAEVLAVMAGLRGTTVEALEQQTTENAMRLFRIGTGG